MTLVLSFRNKKSHNEINTAINCLHGFHCLHCLLALLTMLSILSSHTLHTPLSLFTPISLLSLLEHYEQGWSRPDTAQTFMITRAPAVPTNGFDHPPLGPSTCVVNGTTVVEEVWEGDCYLMGRLWSYTLSSSSVSSSARGTSCLLVIMSAWLAQLDNQGIPGEPQSGDGRHHPHRRGENICWSLTIDIDYWLQILTVFPFPN